MMAKIALAKRYGKPIDGHAPGLRGEDLRKYIAAGPSTDHETYARDEGLEKVRNGMTVIIREGSAAKNLDELCFLIDEYPDLCMLGSDDKHPDDLVRGHIDELVRRALALGYDQMKVLRCASVNPVRHYGLDIGLLRPGDPADFLIVDGFDDLRVLQTYIDGKLVAERGVSRIEPVEAAAPNRFAATATRPEDFRVPARGARINVIVAHDGMLITDRRFAEARVEDGHVVSDVENDVLEIAVLNRYEPAKRPAIGFIANFGLKRGAIASAIAHDSHNIVAVGVTARDLSRAVNLVVANRGGISLVADDRELGLALPVAGLMSAGDGYGVAERYAAIDRAAKDLGSRLTAPYMTLSFMALLLIPHLKLSDRGLFDAATFSFTDLFAA
jgi:adenine deaminase